MILAAYQLHLPPSWNNIRSDRRRRHTTPPPPLRSIICTLSKQGHRFLSSLSAAGDPLAATRLIGKFVASSPKSVALNALLHLLSPNTTHPHLSSTALPLYCRITDASWFSYNPKLVADLVALLYKLGRFEEAESLTSEAVSKLGFRVRDVGLFYCSLVDSHSKQGSKRGFLDSYARLKELASSSSSVYVKRKAYESMISGSCAMDLAHQAEGVVGEMRTAGLKPSVFEFRSIVYVYGKLGLFEDMNRMIERMENEGFAVDTICSNMALSAYGADNNLSQMVLWLRRMKESGVTFSIRTYNSVLNSCPKLALMLENLKICPLSISELIETLKGEEALLVSELIASSVLKDTIVWDSIELKVDLHGMHLGSAYLIMLQLIEELHYRLRAGNWVVPAEVKVVCGLGKHSAIRGESPVKALVKEMMVQMKSPMRIDRKNIGCFIAKGEAVRQWLCNAEHCITR